jgi:hypothetical protein
MSKIPQFSRLAQLPSAEQYAAVELFRGTMVRHSAIVSRDDCTAGPQQISFAGHAWLGYVPVRMPDTIYVQEKLPPDAAAVLINQSHAYTDLYLPIGAAEKRLLDAIDGESSIGAVMARTSLTSKGKEQLDFARTFFERLWWYDQIVFAVPVHGP